MSAQVAVSGTWRAFTRATVFVLPAGNVENDVSGLVVANCPPPTPNCQLGTPSQTTRLISLDSGLALAPSAGDFLAPMLLRQTGIDGHGKFLREEWAMLEIAGGRLAAIEQASSPAYVDHLRAHPMLAEGRPHDPGHLGDLREFPTLPEDGRYMIIQAAGHRYALTPPMVKYRTQAPNVEFDSAAPARLSLRASFDSNGVLEEVELIDGPQDFEPDLAASLELIFNEGSEHRGAMFAVFEIGRRDQRAELLSAVSVLFNCC